MRTARRHIEKCGTITRIVSASSCTIFLCHERVVTNPVHCTPDPENRHPSKLPGRFASSRQSYNQVPLQQCIVVVVHLIISSSEMQELKQVTSLLILYKGNA